jgi:hypothetical protein
MKRIFFFHPTHFAHASELIIVSHSDFISLNVFDFCRIINFELCLLSFIEIQLNLLKFLWIGSKETNPQKWRKHMNEGNIRNSIEFLFLFLS